ncbi:MAG: DNA double-strand break repair nuclease NurA [Anaerolineae bacterium]|nr:DNA double-strand break repair nuclease NurA [Anaerolineae bacterium]
MLHREKVIAALAAKADRFVGYEAELSEALDVYEEALAELAQLSCADVAARLGDLPWPGARPTVEHDRHPRLAVPFAPCWTNHQQARAWAMEVLKGRPTVAVDGSQITPSRDLSIPLGAVQVGWFANPHHEDRRYVKDVSFEVLPPDELADVGREVFGFPDWQVNARRFVGECQKLVEVMEAARDAPLKPICFFDGSLIVSFVEHMLPERQETYLEAVTGMLAASESCRVPLVGYVDTSYAGDLAAMLDALLGRTARQRISDGALLRSRLQWGQRTTAWVAARDDQVRPLAGGKYYERVVFLYLKTAADRPPARLDLPRWLLEAGELEQVMDVVRAECIVGNGYPYAAEAADAVAVITVQDRERFYRVFQEFAAQQGIPLWFSRKAASKRRRRV